MELSDELRAALESQAAYQREQERVEKSLTPLERKLRAKFERAMFGPPGPLELSGFNVSHPTVLLVFAEAYRRKGIELAWGKKAKEARAIKAPYETATWTLIAIWMAVRGHQEFIDALSVRRTTPKIPMLPPDWHQYRAPVYAAMGTPMPREYPKVRPLYQG